MGGKPDGLLIISIGAKQNEKRSHKLHILLIVYEGGETRGSID